MDIERENNKVFLMARTNGLGYCADKISLTKVFIISFVSNIFRLYFTTLNMFTPFTTCNNAKK